MSVPFVGVLVIAGFPSAGLFTDAIIEVSFTIMMLGLITPVALAMILTWLWSTIFGNAAVGRADDDEHSQLHRMLTVMGHYNELSVDVLNPPRPKFWAKAWDEDVRSGPFGAVFLKRNAKAKRARKAWGFFEICFEPVLEAEVEVEKDIHACKGGEREVVKNVWDAIDWLNNREEAGDPWPHDEAYCYYSRHSLFVRLHRIYGRQDKGTEIASLRQTVQQQAETIAKVMARLTALEGKDGVEVKKEE